MYDGLVTDEMVAAYDAAWRTTPVGAPGARRRAGIEAALEVFPGRLIANPAEMAEQHDEEGAEPPLFPGVKFADRVLDEGRTLHLCRGDDGNVYVYCDTDEVADLNQDEVRWLVGLLSASLDNWPQQG